jgi:hypothetical protein
MVDPGVLSNARVIVRHAPKLADLVLADDMKLPHGRWLPWLKDEFGWQDQTARNFMQVFELAAESRNFRDLSIPVSGLYLLAAPSTPEAAREAKG